MIISKSKHTLLLEEIKVREMRNLGLVSAVHLDTWASTIDARYKFGELIRRLVHAGVPIQDITEIDFPANESAQLSGWDGQLNCRSQVCYIPDGASLWEFGTGQNAPAKIRSDFAKRLTTDIPPGWNQGDTTYIAVTLRNLGDRQNLEDELKQQSPWFDVKIYDASNMEQWIQLFPEVETWLQEEGVGAPPSVKTLEKVWREWSQVTVPPISTQLVLTDREIEAQDFRNSLEMGGLISIKSDSSDEGVAFVYSAINAGEPRYREYYLPRVIKVEKESDLDHLLHSKPTYIILNPPLTDKALMLVRAGHTVINALGNSSLGRSINIRLPRSLRSNFSESLTQMGIPKEKAEIDAKACGASAEVWRWWNLLEYSDLSSNIPDWAKSENAELVIPAVLLGGWSDRFEGDKEVIEEFTGLAFSKYRDRLQPFIIMDSPLLVRVGDAWAVTGPATAFALVINNISPGQLELFYRMVLKVFQEIDPIVDITPDERPYSSLRIGGIRHSAWIRDGMTDTLLRIAVLGKPLEDYQSIPGNHSAQSYVDGLIRNLPGLSNDWRLLASLRNQLPVLAEAAPIPFLEALERLLQGDPNNILPLFAEGESTFGHSFHPHILWAIETLAWEPKYLGRAALILARLTKLDPGGKLSNRPIRSLTDILLAWHPSTNANLDQRLEVLDLILNYEPIIGWNVLMNLMPSSRSIAHSTHNPEWRDLGSSNKEVLTHAVVWKAYQQYVERAIHMAGMDSNRWIKLITYYDNVADVHQQAMEDGLGKLAHSVLPEEIRIKIWKTIMAFINRHKSFPDAKWALPAERLDRLEIIVELFSPTDYGDQIAWLFNEFFPDIPYSKEDMKETEKEIDRFRSESVKKVWNEGGLASLIALIDKVSYPALLVNPWLQLVPTNEEIMAVFEVVCQGSDNQRAFGRFLSGQTYNKFGDIWINLIICMANEHSWSIEAKVDAIIDFPDTREIFDLATSFGSEIEQLYWKLRKSWFKSEDDEIFLFFIAKMMSVERALDLIVSNEQIGHLDSNEIIIILDQVLKEINQGKFSPASSSMNYWIEKLFDILRDRGDVDKYELAKREYAFLPILAWRFDKKDLILHQLLATNAGLFITIICDLYKPSSSEQEEPNPSEMEKDRAEYAWHILQSWHSPPGIVAETVNGDLLRQWVQDARCLAAEKDRVAVTDQHIGHVLYYSPSDPTDCIWPHIKLRQLLEELQSHDIEIGIENEQFNSRGVTTKGLYEGGKQEREIAIKWRAWADAINLRWIRTKSLLERIADSWERHAQKEDERAEKDRLRLS